MFSVFYAIGLTSACYCKTPAAPFHPPIHSISIRLPFTLFAYFIAEYPSKRMPRICSHLATNPPNPLCIQDVDQGVANASKGSGCFAGEFILGQIVTSCQDAVSAPVIEFVQQRNLLNHHISQAVLILTCRGQTVQLTSGISCHRGRRPRRPKGIAPVGGQLDPVVLC